MLTLTPDWASQLPAQVAESYFGPWAIIPQVFNDLVQTLQGINIHAHFEQNTDHNVVARGPDEEYEAFVRVGRDRDIAMISLVGPITKYSSSMMRTASLMNFRYAMRQVERAKTINKVVLRIDSPGGSASGVQEAANAVRRLRQSKEVVTYFEDLGASAAYWIGSQAGKVYANTPAAMVGSIGTYAVVTDSSASSEKLGVKVHVIRAGDYKGIGTPGTEVTQEQLDEFQRLVTSINDQFLEGVATGRGVSLEAVQALADGRIHPAAVAKDLGLIDGILSFDEVVESLDNPKKERVSMSANSDTTTRTPATIAEIRSACEGCSDTFLLTQVEAGATVADAVQAYAKDLLARNKALEAEQSEKDKAYQKELKAAEEKAAATASMGVAPLKTAGSADATDIGDPVAVFDQLVRERVAKGEARLDAVARVAAANPKLHQAFLLATNPSRKIQRLVTEKYED